MILMTVWFFSSFIMRWLTTHTYESYEFWSEAELVVQICWICVGLLVPSWFLVLAAAYVALIRLYDRSR